MEKRNTQLIVNITTELIFIFLDEIMGVWWVWISEMGFYKGRETCRKGLYAREFASPRQYDE
jgi:low temperature requirement protein LtrA